jgi:hypothetical protein
LPRPARWRGSRRRASSRLRPGRPIHRRCRT